MPRILSLETLWSICVKSPRSQYGQVSGAFRIVRLPTVLDRIASIPEVFPKALRTASREHNIATKVGVLPESSRRELGTKPGKVCL